MRLLLLTFLVLSTQAALAISIDWSGGYRIEFNDIDNPSLDTNAKVPKTYGLQYLYLNPKIVASDGINIIGRFDILGSTVSSYRNSQLGSVFGSGGGTLDRRINSQTQETSSVGVSQLYLNVNHEYGSLIAGRAPFEFGLGMTYSAGLKPFDHWYDTRDGVAYKFIIDNISFMPMLSKVSQKDYGRGVTASDETIVFEYNNKDNGAQAGVIQQTRKSSFESNDALTAPGALPFGGAAVNGAWSTKTVNLFLGREWESFSFKLETSFLTGDTGLVVAGSNLKFNSYGIAAELLFPAKEDEKWEFGAKFGIASGDNPNTTDVYEGYQFDRNYDVAMLLFNHRMGQRDFLTTGLLHTRDAADGLSVGNSADDEAIGNVTYLAPSMKYKWNDKLDIRSSLIYAQLVTNPTLTLDTTKDLGTELDIEFIYKPRERVIWSNGLGVLFPGSAWKNGASNLENKYNIGFSTKAAITF
ncbi:hypothetical protein K2P97_08875 [bacterium]|nr:hypothetical protein [bacterium]